MIVFLPFFFFSFHVPGRAKKHSNEICNQIYIVHKEVYEKKLVRWIGRETEHILKQCALFAECSLCEDWWIRKKLEAAVLCLSKNKILHRSSKHNTILPPFHCISALTWKDNSLMCWKPFRFPFQAGTDSFLSYARNKIDLQKLIKIQFSKSLGTRVTLFTLKARHSLI